MRSDDAIDVRNEIADFILSNYLFGDSSRTPADEELLVEVGIIDSTGVLELIDFLECRFCISVLEAETVPANLGSIANLTSFVLEKRAVHGSGRSASQHE